MALFIFHWMFRLALVMMMISLIASRETKHIVDISLYSSVPIMLIVQDLIHLALLTVIHNPLTTLKVIWNAKFSAMKPRVLDNKSCLGESCGQVFQNCCALGQCTTSWYGAQDCAQKVAVACCTSASWIITIYNKCRYWLSILGWQLFRIKTSW